MAPTGTPVTSGTTGSTAGQPPTTHPPAQADPATAATAQTSASGGQADQEEARQHLTAARGTLSAMTQLPAAAQLSGEARTQVAQLISSFNELITTQSQWRESYAKVNANLTALLGPDPAATDPTNASGTSGAVGTSGSTTAPATATIDPAVREKLVELRRSLTAFEKAASGGAASTSASGGAASTSSTAAATDPTSSAATQSAAAQSAATQSSATQQPTQSAAAQTTGTSGTTTAAQGTGSGNADVMKHVAGIEALLKMQDDSGGLTLTKAQVEQLRTHWAALRASIEKK